MKILIIGGTKFLGRHLILAARAGGHEVTIFNRGRHSSEDFAGVEQIRGDRNTNLDRLEGRVWDVCIDTCGYLPGAVKLSAERLKDAVGQYIFVSSISAYASFPEVDFDETAPLARLSDEQKKRAGAIDSQEPLTGAVLGDMYGALKVLCEEEAERAMPGRVLQVRSGLIVGPYDPTDRFTYWVMRVASGGEVLAPGEPDRFVQMIDARDLAEWIVKMAETDTTGIFHAGGKTLDLTFGQMLEEIKAVTGSDAHLTWVDEEFLKRENIGEWGDMPLYLYESDAEAKGFLTANIDKMLETGAAFRPLEDTVRETFAWRKTVADEMKAGISAEREAELLKKWHESD